MTKQYSCMSNNNRFGSDSYITGRRSGCFQDSCSGRHACNSRSSCTNTCGSCSSACIRWVLEVLVRVVVLTLVVVISVIAFGGVIEVVVEVIVGVVNISGSHVGSCRSRGISSIVLDSLQLPHSTQLLSSQRPHTCTVINSTT